MPPDAEPTPIPPSPDRVAPASPVPPERPALAPDRRRYLLIEIGVVLLLAVVPDIYSAVAGLLWDRTGPDYHFGQLSTHIVIRSLQVSAPVLFILWRSAEAWPKFGLAPIRWRDAPLGLGLYAVMFIVYTILVAVVWPVVADAGLNSTGSLDRLVRARPTGLVGAGLLLVMAAANGLAEELVMRSYLITRLRELGLNKPGAIVISAALFAAYHVYQGFWGASTAFADGIILGLAFTALRRLWPVAIAHALADMVPYLY